MRLPEGCHRLLFSASLLVVMTACAQFPTQDHGPASPVNVSNVPNAVPRYEPKSPYGNSPTYTVNGKTYHVLPSCAGYHERGIASWYGTKFHGSRTSDGDIYDMYTMTAASKVLPLPCFVQVTNLKNGKTAIVKVNDRGPFVANRIIDLSYAAAARIGMLGRGTALVDVAAVMPGESPKTAIAESSPPAQKTGEAAVGPVGRPLIFLQVGAFANRSNAEHVLQKLRLAAVTPAFILTEIQNGVTFYKVRIGPLPDVSRVDTLSAQLQTLGFNDAQVVIP